MFIEACISTQYNQSDHFYKEMNPLDLKHGIILDLDAKKPQCSH